MNVNEEIARLTGKLVFEVNSAPLQRFQALMARSTQHMAKMGAEYNKLAASMNKSLKIKVDTTALDKAKAKLDNAMSREHRAEVALGNQKRTTFAAELSQQKLTYAGTKQQAGLVSGLLKSQQEGAVVAAKAHAVQMRAKGMTKQQFASQNALTASLAKQARLEAIAAKTRATTQKANNAHLKSMTQIQRIQQVMNQAQTTAQQRAAKHTVQLASLQQANANKVTNQAQKDQKFQWQMARQQQWQANQNARNSQSSSGFGAMGGLMALGGIGAVVGGLTAAIGALNNRMKERQEGVQEAQGFNNTFMSISNNPEIVKAYRDSFIRSQNENGGTIDTDTAKDFRTLAINMAAAGKTLDQITDTWNVRQQAFSVAGTSKEDNKELNKQLGQMASDGTGAASDANIINDRAPMLTPYVVREYMAEKGITDYQKGLGAYNKDLKGGKGVKYAWYDNAMRKLVKDNGESLERNRNSVATAQQRADNQAYLNTNNINSDAELSQVIKDRIQAERELNEAMQPLKTSLAQFDIALTGVMTGALRMMANKNADGSEKSDQQKTQESLTTADVPVSLSMVGTHDYSNVDGNSQHQGGPIGGFYNWLFNVKDNRESDKKQAGDLVNQPPDIWNQKETPFNQAVMPGFMPQLGLNMEEWQKQAGDWSKLTPNINDEKETPYRQAIAPGFLPKLEINMDNFLKNAEAFNRVQETNTAVNFATQPPVGVMAPATITNAPVVNIEGAKINIELHGKATEEDSALVMTHVTQELDKRDANIPQLVDRALSNMIGNSRSMQSQVRQ
ncbi:hypothetical protein BSF44_35180 [Pseudomonas sp. ACN8]|uniref:hypothetical protein n=1 Tax=Pseudomonas sp. ACN8 TaxID=1920428 RepID=UPI000BB2FCA6|nr:hypothetical protein [Pseudomonas sp. ACN8]PBJ21655.1 hypothetical protein BSF44_35180 [Pseudomonas sp. ACN8]